MKQDYFTLCLEGKTAYYEYRASASLALLPWILETNNQHCSHYLIHYHPTPNTLQEHGPSSNLHTRTSAICDEARLRLGPLLGGSPRHASEEALSFVSLQRKRGKEDDLDDIMCCIIFRIGFTSLRLQRRYSLLLMIGLTCLSSPTA
jgi:hypothetical protein